MKRAKIMFLVLLVAVRIKAQQDYFVLIQAENGQPFYVRMADHTYSSSSGGHIILGHLRDSSYNLFIGFPRSQGQELHFHVSIPKKDLGFILKNIVPSGWALLNGQTAALLEPVNDMMPAKDSYAGMTRRSDLFATLMAGVVNDSAVLYTIAMNDDHPANASKTAAARQPGMADSMIVAHPPKNIDMPARAEKAPDSTKAAPVTKAEVKTPEPLKTVDSAAAMQLAKSRDKIDSSQVAKNMELPATVPARADTLPARKNVSATKPAGSMQWRYANTDVKDDEKSVIVKLQEKDTSGGRQMVYVDKRGKEVDTIRLAITTGIEAGQTAATEKPAGNAAVFPAYTGPDKKKRDSTSAMASYGDSSHAVADSGMKSTAAVTSSSPIGTAEMKPAAMVNSDCRNMANEHEVDKLRVKMLEARKLDDKLAAARKIFRTHCFTTNQIRALSELFYDDESRFGFFETAYPFVSDTGNFKSLVKLLSDPAYMSRFKAMVRM